MAAVGGAVKDDARSRKPGLRQAPPKSRKLQEPENGDTLANPPRYRDSLYLVVWRAGIFQCVRTY